MARSRLIDSEELDDAPLRFAHEDPLPAAKRRGRRDEDDDVEPLELGDTSNGSRFGKLIDRDLSGSW
jgi:hypothetical protein